MILKALRRTYTSLTYLPQKAFMPTSQSLRIGACTRVELPPKMEIALTDVEDKIFALLDQCTRHMKQEKGITTSCRIAGGWARDKLLGSESNDIDIAVTDMMGVAFAQHFVPFLEEKGIPVTSIAKVERNPDQSKHLETAKITILGRELDIVNLRSEEYAEDSRIPTDVKFGTPLEDALRRDITINSLFYNVHTRAVEDLTEKGLNDLRDGIIRTPLPPRETFRDDPLRVIRCIRFASRFGFMMVPELEAAARLPEIQEQLSMKISRERIGEELDKMLKGRDPLMSIRTINSLSLYPSVFLVPPTISNALSATPAPFIVSESAVSILHALLHPSPHSPIPSLHPTFLSHSTLTPSTKARMYLAAALTPFKNIKYSAKKKEHLAVEAVIREGLKLGTQNHYLDAIPLLFDAAELLKNPSLDSEKFSGIRQRTAIGLLLREKAIHNANTGSHWVTSLLFSLVQELAPLYDPTADKLQAEKASACIHLYNNFVSRIEQLDLPRAVDSKPILDGREVIGTLGASESGAWTGRVLAKVIEWQLQHPNKGKEECKEWLKSEQISGGVVVDEGRTGTRRGTGGGDGDVRGSKKAKR